MLSEERTILLKKSTINNYASSFTQTLGFTFRRSNILLILWINFVLFVSLLLFTVLTFSPLYTTLPSKYIKENCSCLIKWSFRPCVVMRTKVLFQWRQTSNVINIAIAVGGHDLCHRFFVRYHLCHILHQIGIPMKTNCSSPLVDLIRSVKSWESLSSLLNTYINLFI